jgi:uncharacterized membrane protein
MRTNKELDDAIKKLKKPDRFGLFGKLISLVVWAVVGLFTTLFIVIKFSFLVFLPIGLALMLVSKSPIVGGVILAIVVGYFVNKMIWSGGREDNKREKYRRHFENMKK